MEKRTRNAFVTAVTGTVAAGALATGLVAINADTGAVRSTTSASLEGPVSPGALANGLEAKAEKNAASSLTASESFNELGAKVREKKASRSGRSHVKKTAKPDAGMPSGTATATSFWDPQTASGKPMSYETLASPYWPLGTRVLITYNGQSTVGVVDDFGPAEWAVAQHSPPAIIDISEKMMVDFTGSRSNAVTVQFQVLEMGSGSTYRSSGTGYDLAMGD
ncbi:hypothetical protein [Actinomadura alba]|uniref:RlpA-like protein double-psi beta-barrel domain-containing protein n=1 Tax=Actinomadura alba TaxID=406431 RepID=A0ABR7LU63_9ACTN|nr:hypothetical protein [Actinomadura alba]MBC6468296.1 hypothetical protein [Actinomadura alba]